MDAAVAFLVVAYAAPLAHVALAPGGGPFLPPPGSACPIGPRLGWLTLVLLLGPFGWLLYLRARRRRLHAAR